MLKLIVILGAGLLLTGCSGSSGGDEQETRKGTWDEMKWDEAEWA